MPLSASACAGLKPSCMIHKLVCPPPGATIIPTPVAISFFGRNTMIDGLWTLSTVSPSIFSGSSFRASDPGAPFGQRNTVGFPGGTTTAGGFWVDGDGDCWAIAGMAATPRETTRANVQDFIGNLATAAWGETRIAFERDTGRGAPG